MTLYAGCVPTSGAAPRPQTVVDRLAEPWHDLGCRCPASPTSS